MGTLKRHSASLVLQAAVEPAGPERVFMKIDEELQPARWQHAFESVGELAIVRPERLHERSQSGASWQAREEHLSATVTEPGRTYGG
ncbi:hypothetical protein GCM10012319_74090 [Comamonas sp. KCTC 72670]|nr:hypothetical protein GCM10012319_74090 [Comamonas sp. KCTC 72670]